MKGKNMLNLTEITFNDEIDILGKFSLIENMNDWEGNNIDGSLIFKDGSARLKILGNFPNPKNAEARSPIEIGGNNELQSSTEASIYGFLSNGNYIKIESFMLSNTSDNYPGLKTSEYKIFRLRIFNYVPKKIDEKFDYYKIDINNLVYWGSLPHFSHGTDYSTVSPSIDLGLFEKDNLSFSLKLEPGKFIKHDQHHLEIFNRLNFIIEPTDSPTNSQLNSVAEDLNKIVSILINAPSYVRSIRGSLKSDALQTTVISSFGNVKDLSKFVPQTNQLSYFHLQSEFSEILKTFFIRDEELNSIVSTVFTNISVRNTVESRLVNNSSAIDILYKNRRFSDNTKVKNLKQKLKLFISDLPGSVRSSFFETEEESSLFCEQIKSTRDYFVHGINPRESILRDVKLLSETNKLDYILIAYVCLKLGIPEENITEYLRNQKLSISENDIIQ